MTAADQVCVLECAWPLSGAEIGLLKKLAFCRFFFLFLFILFGMLYMLGIVHLQKSFRTQEE